MHAKTHSIVEALARWSLDFFLAENAFTRPTDATTSSVNVSLTRITE